MDWDFPDSEIERLMTYHAPKDHETVARYTFIKRAAVAFAKAIRDNCPSSADRTHAIRCVREARMWANASIALRRPELELGNVGASQPQAPPNVDGPGGTEPENPGV